MANVWGDGLRLSKDPFERKMVLDLDEMAGIDSKIPYSEDKDVKSRTRHDGVIGEIEESRKKILTDGKVTRDEMDRYIHHRLTVSGSMGRPHFTPWALRHLFKASRGIPRIINNLCDKSLLSAFIRESDEVNYWDARRAAKDLEKLTD